MTTKREKQIAFFPDDATLSGIEAIRGEMARREKQPDTKHGYSNSAVLRFAVAEFQNLLNARGGRKPTGIGEKVMQRIRDVFNEQVKINTTTTETIKIGKGLHEVSVKYRQRAITEKWLRDHAKVNAEAVAKFFSENAAEIEAHNKWLVANCGYPVSPGVNGDPVENFNRRTSKAELAKLAEMKRQAGNQGE